MEAKSLPKRYKYLLHVLDDMSEHMVEKIEVVLIHEFRPTHIRPPMQLDLVEC